VLKATIVETLNRAGPSLGRAITLGVPEEWKISAGGKTLTRTERVLDFHSPCLGDARLSRAGIPALGLYLGGAERLKEGF
jgi:hypothetical protein